ncbi:MAG: hypothetical protein KGI06_03220 [Candidatus Micrarchaeota archaeon]|nr:hypothetical protein [Candidatus Micrarchaeota archaeon]
MVEKTHEKHRSQHRYTPEIGKAKTIGYIETDFNTISSNPRLFNKKRVKFVGRIEKIHKSMMVPYQKNSIEDKLPLIGSTDRFVSGIYLKRSVYKPTLSIDLKDTSESERKRYVRLIIEISKVGKDSFEKAIALKPGDSLEVKGIVSAIKESGPAVETVIKDGPNKGLKALRSGGKWVEGSPSVSVIEYKVLGRD